MFFPHENSSKELCEPAPRVLSEASSDTLSTGVGGFRLSAYYGGERSKLSKRQFSGKTKLDLHDEINGEAVVAISDMGLMSVAYVRSTGHDVSLLEFQRPNLLVPIAGTLSSRNQHMLFEGKNEPWLLIGRGARETTVRPELEAIFQAFVLSIPPSLLGDRLTRVEARGGMIWGSANGDNDLQLARLTVALATQITLSTDMELDAHMAQAWTTVVLDQMNRCLDACLADNEQEPIVHSHNPSLIHVRKAEALIQERPNEISSLKEIASHVGVSERTLQVAFRKERGATPMQLLARTKLHRARLALLDREGPNTVTDVCSLCGIEHHGRFSKRYKEAFGENPVATLHLRARR